MYSNSKASQALPTLSSLGNEKHLRESQASFCIVQITTFSGEALRNRYSALCVEKFSLRGTLVPPRLYLVNGFVTSILQAQVHHGVLQSATHVELQGQVVNALRRQSETLTHSTALCFHQSCLKSRADPSISQSRDVFPDWLLAPAPEHHAPELFVRRISCGMPAKPPPRISLPTAFYRKISLPVKCFPN